MPYANLQPVFDDATLALAVADVQNCLQRLPFLVNLTPQEKTQYLKLGPKLLPFVSRALMHCKNNPVLQVSFSPLAEWENDWQVCQRLEALQVQVQVLQEALADTIIALKQESTRAALAFYNNAQKAATFNVPGSDSIIADLQPMLPGRKPRNKNAALQTTNTTNNNTQ